MPDPRALVEQLDALSSELIERFFNSFNLEADVKQTLAALGNPTRGFGVVAIGFQQLDIGRSNRVHGKPSEVLRQILLVFEFEAELFFEYFSTLRHIFNGNRNVLDAFDLHGVAPVTQYEVSDCGESGQA